MTRSLNFKDYVSDEYTFQIMCCEILTTQPDGGPRPGLDPYGHIDTYGGRGQKQFGVDLQAQRTDGKWDLGQCKDYEKLNKGNIIESVDEFLREWDSKWQSLGVARFILFASCKTSDTSLQDEVSRQIARLQKKGVGFELWGGDRLLSELHQRRTLYERYAKTLPGYQEGCQMATVKCEKKLSLLSSFTENTLGSFLVRWEARPRSEVLTELQKKEEEAGRAKDFHTQAKLIRLRATLLMNERSVDIGTLRAMRNRVEGLVPHDTENERMEARILDYEGKTDQAILVLEMYDDIRSLVQRAGLLIGRAGSLKNEGKRASDLSLATQLLARPELMKDPDARRLEAVRLMHGFKGSPPNLEAALKAIEESLNLRESWVARFIKGTLLFWSAISPVARPTNPVDLPPLGFSMMVLPDEQANRHLAEADLIFDSLRNASDLPSYRDRATIWRMAALSARGNPSGLIQSMVLDILSYQPLSPIMVFYTLESGEELDLDRIRHVAKEKVASGEESELWHQVFYHPRIRPFSDQEAILELEKLREKALERPKDHPVQIKGWWLNQMANRLMATGRHNDVSELLSLSEEDTALGKYIKLLLLKNDPSEVADLLSGEIDSEPLWLTYLVESLLASKQVEKASEFALRLASEVKTLSAYTLGLRAAFLANKPEIALNLLEAWPMADKDVQSESTHIWALKQTGQLPEALRKARALARRDGLTRLEEMHLQCELLHLLLCIGKSDEARIVARDLSDQYNTEFDSVEDGILLSTVLAGDPNSRPLAVKVLHSLLGCSLSDDQMIRIFLVGSKLGVEEVSKKIAPMLPNLTARNPQIVYKAELSDVVKLINSQREHGAKQEELWRKGEIPVHFLAVIGRGLLPRIYHAIPHAFENQRDVAPGPLPVFHGSRTRSFRERQMSNEQAIPQEKEIRCPLLADITSLMLAEHLEILDTVVSFFGPIRLPGATLELLLHNAHGLEHPQPYLVNLHRQVVEAADGGRLKTFSLEPDSGDVVGIDFRSWRRRRAKANEIGAVYFPGNPDARPPEDSEPIMRRRTLITIFRADLDQNSLVQLQERFLLSDRMEGTETDLAPSSGSPIVTDTLLLHELAETPRALEVFLSIFKVHISDDDLEMDRAQVLGAEEANTLRLWVERLHGKIADGLTTSPPRYEMEGTRCLQSDAQNVREVPLEFQFISSFIDRCADRTNIWSDDRYINRIPNSDQVHIYTTLDLLKFLLTQGQIGEDEYFRVLLRLRRGGFLYVPVTAQEIVHHLKAAPIQQREVVETPELKTLRRTIARSILDPNHFQLALENGLEKCELQYVLDTSREVVDALREVRARGSDDGSARFAWILNSLYFEESYIGTFEAYRDEPERYRSLRATAAVRLMSSHIQLLDPDAQRNYMNLLWEIIVSHWFEEDVEIQEQVVNRINANTMLFLDKSFDQIKALEQIKVLGANCFLALPKPIQEGIKERYGLPTELGIYETRKLRLGDLGLVESRHFVQSLTLAMREGEASCQSSKGETIKICCRDGCVYLETNTMKHQFRDELILAACDPQSSQWTAYCENHSRELDLPFHLRQTIVAQLKALADPMERIESYRQEIEKSQEWRLLRLHDISRMPENLTRRDFEPASVIYLLGHLRLDTNEVDQTLENNESLMVERLMADFDPTETFFRLAGLPSGVPTSFAEHLTTIDEEERNAVLDRIFQLSRTAVDLTEAIYIALRVDASRAAELIQNILANICETDIKALFEGLLLDIIILGNMENYFYGRLSTNREISGVLLAQLAGVHSNQVLHLLKVHSYDMSSANQHFENWTTNQVPPRFEIAPSDDGVANVRRNPLDRFLRLAGLLTELAREIPEETRTLLNEHLAPLLETARDQWDCGDTFWRRGGFDDIRIRLLTKVAPEMLPEANNGTRLDKARESLLRINETPQSTSPFDQLVRIFGDQPVPLALEDCLQTAIRSLDVGREDAINCFRFFCFLASAMLERDNAIFTLLEERLINLAEVSQSQAPQLEAAARQLSSYSRTTTPLQTYKRLVNRMVDRNSCLASELLPILLQVALKTRSEDAPQVWALVIRLRVIANRLGSLKP